MKALPAPWAMMMAKAINAQIMDTAAAGARAMTDSRVRARDRKSTRLNSSHGYISYAVFCLKKKKIKIDTLFSSMIHSWVMMVYCFLEWAQDSGSPWRDSVVGLCISLGLL